MLVTDNTQSNKDAAYSQAGSLAMLKSQAETKSNNSLKFAHASFVPLNAGSSLQAPPICININKNLLDLPVSGNSKSQAVSPLFKLHSKNSTGKSKRASIRKIIFISKNFKCKFNLYVGELFLIEFYQHVHQFADLAYGLPICVLLTILMNT